MRFDLSLSQKTLKYHEHVSNVDAASLDIHDIVHVMLVRCGQPSQVAVHVDRPQLPCLFLGEGHQVKTCLGGASLGHSTRRTESSNVPTVFRKCRE